MSERKYQTQYLCFHCWKTNGGELCKPHEAAVRNGQMHDNRPVQLQEMDEKSWPEIAEEAEGLILANLKELE